MLTYALGRGLERDDRCTVDDVVAKHVVQNKYHVFEPGAGIVKSDPFQKRRGKRGGQ